jgi:hypothetical protein
VKTLPPRHLQVVPSSASRSLFWNFATHSPNDCSVDTVCMACPDLVHRILCAVGYIVCKLWPHDSGQQVLRGLRPLRRTGIWMWLVWYSTALNMSLSSFPRSTSDNLLQDGRPSRRRHFLGTIWSNLLADHVTGSTSFCSSGF